MKSISRIILLSFFVIFLAGMILPTSALAESIRLDTAFSNWNPPFISLFGMVEITDLGNNVQFEISGLSDGAGGSGSDLQWFYINTTTDITLLSLVSSTAPATLDYSFNSLNTLFKADGDGFFDGRLDFGDGAPQVSGVTFELGASGVDLKVDDFLAQSFGGDQGAFTVAAHIQSTNTPFTSEFVGGNPTPTPEPATMLLLGSGLIGLAGFRRKFRKK